MKRGREEGGRPPPGQLTAENVLVGIATLPIANNTASSARRAGNIRCVGGRAPRAGATAADPPGCRHTMRDAGFRGFLRALWQVAVTLAAGPLSPVSGAASVEEHGADPQASPASGNLRRPGPVEHPARRDAPVLRVGGEGSVDGQDPGAAHGVGATSSLAAATRRGAEQAGAGPRRRRRSGPPDRRAPAPRLSPGRAGSGRWSSR